MVNSKSETPTNNTKDMPLNIAKRIIPKGLLKIILPTYHFALAWLADLRYRHPSGRLIVIGVTGTTGKTTSAYLIAKMLENAGYRVGFTSTALFSDGKYEWLNNKKMTMVGGFFTQKMIFRMAENGCQFAIIETTSEGVKQYRHRFINYDALVYTGLYPEHIEAHGGFENYKQAKGELFKHLKRCQTKYIDAEKRVLQTSTGLKKLELARVKKTIIANLDDEHAGYFLAHWAERKIGYTEGGAAEFAGDSDTEVISFKISRADRSGLGLALDGIELDLKMLGRFNASNAMNAVSVGAAFDLAPFQIKEGLESIFGVPGRLEIIDCGQPFTVIVDYAFEPKAVAKLYEAIEMIPHNRVIHVLGSTGGGRDTQRRPILGKIAGEKADYAIITNEDPYDDDPLIIIKEVAMGAEKAGKKEGIDMFKMLDRRKAIAKALSLAEEGDIVLITGKGSEQAICAAKGEKIPWDDREVARELLGALE